MDAPKTKTPASQQGQPPVQGQAPTDPGVKAPVTTQPGDGPKGDLMPVPDAQQDRDY